MGQRRARRAPSPVGDKGVACRGKEPCSKASPTGGGLVARGGGTERSIVPSCLRIRSCSCPPLPENPDRGRTRLAPAKGEHGSPHQSSPARRLVWNRGEVGLPAYPGAYLARVGSGGATSIEAGSVQHGWAPKGECMKMHNKKYPNCAYPSNGKFQFPTFP